MGAAFAVIGGVLNRLRGSEHAPGGSTVKRIVWGCATAIYAWIVADIDWHAAAIMAPLFWAGLVWGWGQWMDLGRFGGDFRSDFIALTIRGLFVTLPAGAAAWWWTGDPAWAAVAASGAAMAPLYEAAWRIPVRWPFLEQGPPLGELLFGTWIWLVIWLFAGGA